MFASYVTSFGLDQTNAKILAWLKPGHQLRAPLGLFLMPQLDIFGVEVALLTVATLVVTWIYLAHRFEYVERSRTEGVTVINPTAYEYIVRDNTEAALDALK